MVVADDAPASNAHKIGVESVNPDSSRIGWNDVPLKAH
jgi:hypothetical protein